MYHFHSLKCLYVISSYVMYAYVIIIEKNAELVLVYKRKSVENKIAELSALTCTGWVNFAD